MEDVHLFSDSKLTADLLQTELLQQPVNTYLFAAEFRLKGLAIALDKDQDWHNPKLERMEVVIFITGESAKIHSNVTTDHRCSECSFWENTSNLVFFALSFCLIALTGCKPSFRQCCLENFPITIFFFPVSICCLFFFTV